jgi:hypothetical protein
MFKILSTYICRKGMYKMQHMEASSMPVLYLGHTVLKGYSKLASLVTEIKRICAARIYFNTHTAVLLFFQSYSISYRLTVYPYFRSPKTAMTELHSFQYLDLSSRNKRNLISPLNAELNPICHLLILLGDLTFMGKCIVSIYNKM